MTKKDIAIAFSTGCFEKTFQFLNEKIEWKIIGENCFTGKADVVTNCKQTAEYFKSVTTDFAIEHIIEEPNYIAITGSAKFSKEGALLAHISACDVYEFNVENQIVKISSYCIAEKK